MCVDDWSLYCVVAVLLFVCWLLFDVCRCSLCVVCCQLSFVSVSFVVGRCLLFAMCRCVLCVACRCL